MITPTVTQPITPGSFGLVWTLVTRAVGLTAGLGVAMLIMAALMSAP
jgi:hypothetical protein